MKVTATVNTSRCEAGNFDASIVIEIDRGSGYGSNPPLIGAIDHAFDGARKALVGAIEADRKGRS